MKIKANQKKKKRGVVQQLGSGLMELIGMDPNATKSVMNTKANPYR
jgi:hypothetical protein